MNGEQFEEAVKKILHRQPSEKVDMFLQSIDFEKWKEMTNFMDRGLKTITDKNYLDDAETSLKCLTRIEKQTYGHVSNDIQSSIHTVIGWLETVASLNKKFKSGNKRYKSGGRPTKLSESEYHVLEILQNTFRRCFPDNSSKFTHGTLLCQIGQLLLDKTLPKQVDKHLLERKIKFHSTAS